MLKKFRWNISIYGWNETTPGFRKRTAAIWSRFWSKVSHQRVTRRSYDVIFIF